MKDFRVIFMGTPDFAVGVLKALIDGGINIIAVVTGPDKPAGRGLKLKPSAVKQFAVEHNLPVLQPQKLKDSDFIQELKDLKPDLNVVVAFRMLPEVVFNLPRLGSINLHASILPQYRGAAPINRAIMEGETETGVTTFFLDKEIDTGGILLQEKVPVFLTDNAGSLHDRLMVAGADLTLKTVRLLMSGNYSTVPQHRLIEPEKELKMAPKLFRADCQVDWSKPLMSVYNQIRGLSPYPGAFTMLSMDDGAIVQLKLFDVDVIEGKHHSPAGTIITDNKTYLYFTADGGLIDVKELQLEGKRRMKTEELLRGLKNISEYKVIDNLQD